MNQANQLFADFSRAMTSRGMVPLSDEQFDMLMGYKNQSWVVDKLQGIQDAVVEDIEAIEKWSALARLATGLDTLGIPGDLPLALRLVRDHGRERVMSLLSNARRDQDPAHLAELRRMVNQAVDGMESGGRAAPANTSPPPRQDAPASGQSRPLPQQPPPPGTRTQRAYSRPDTPQGNTRQVARQAPRQPDRAPPPRDNVVTEFRQDRRQGGQRQSEHYDDDGQYAATGDAGGADKTAYDSETAFNRGNNGCAVRFQNAVDTRKADQVRHVVFVESAPINPQTGNTYLWEERKITLMLNKAETEQALMVMYGLIPSVRFTAHGADKKGWMNIANQPRDSRYAGCIQVQVGRGGGTLTTNIFPIQLSWIKGVLLRAYTKMLQTDSQDAALRHLQMSARNFADYAEANPPRPQQNQSRHAR